MFITLGLVYTTACLLFRSNWVTALCQTCAQPWKIKMEWPSVLCSGISLSEAGHLGMSGDQFSKPANLPGRRPEAELPMAKIAYVFCRPRDTRQWGAGQGPNALEATSAGNAISSSLVVQLVFAVVIILFKAFLAKCHFQNRYYQNWFLNIIARKNM